MSKGKRLTVAYRVSRFSSFGGSQGRGEEGGGEERIVTHHFSSDPFTATAVIGSEERQERDVPAARHHCSPRSARDMDRGRKGGGWLKAGKPSGARGGGRAKRVDAAIFA